MGLSALFQDHPKKKLVVIANAYCTYIHYLDTNLPKLS